jgi:hypothetical protein
MVITEIERILRETSTSINEKPFSDDSMRHHPKRNLFKNIF